MRLVIQSMEPDCTVTAGARGNLHEKGYGSIDYTECDAAGRAEYAIWNRWQGGSGAAWTIAFGFGLYHWGYGGKPTLHSIGRGRSGVRSRERCSLCEDLRSRFQPG